MDLPSDVNSTNTNILPNNPGINPVSELSDNLGYGDCVTARGTTDSTSYSNVLGSEVPQYIFSARTCIELIHMMSNKQIDTEIKHLIALDASVSNFIATPETNTYPCKRDLLRQHLAESLVKEVDTIVNKYDLLVQNLSRSVNEAEQMILKQEQKRATNNVNEPQLKGRQEQQLGNIPSWNPKDY